MVSPSSAGTMKQLDGGGQLLQELEALSHALYRGSRHSISVLGSEATDKQQQKEGYHKRQRLQENGGSERKGMWNWKPLRALAHIGQQRISCVFLAKVLAIKNLPSSTNGLRLLVHFRQKDSFAQTLPCRASNGCAEFDETLRIRCTVYGSRKGSQGIKYTSKSFILSVIAPDANELDLGRHLLDLTKILPESLDEQEDRQNDLDRATSFSLSGKAKGGRLMVAFGYEILDKEIRGADGGELVESPMRKGMPNFNSLPNSPQIMSAPAPADALFASPSSSTLGVAMTDDYLPMEHLSLADAEEQSNFSKGMHRPRSLSQSDIRFAEFSTFDPDHQEISRLNAMKWSESEPREARSSEQQHGAELDLAAEDDMDFEVEDHGVEISTMSVDVPMHLPLTAGNEERLQIHQQTHKKLVSLYFPSVDERDGDAKMREKSQNWIEEKKIKVALPKMREEGVGLCSDNEADLVAGEFLNMLEEGQGSDSDPSSPRALLLKQFEKEAMLEGGLGLELTSPKDALFYLEDDSRDSQNSQIVAQKGQVQEDVTIWSDEDSGLAAIMDVAETELQKAAQTMRSKERAKMLEDAETEELMHQWGLDEKAFQSSPSPPRIKHGLNSAASLLPPPPLAEGFDAVIPTRDGGSLRSMSSAHFRRGLNFEGSLVMHVSKPVVVPVDMGSTALDILQAMAASGMEQMANQAMQAMPLDDITGKSVHQIAIEGRAALEGHGHRSLALGSRERDGLDSGQTTYVHGYSGEHRSTDLYYNSQKGLSGGFERKSKPRSRNSIDPFEEYMSLEELAPFAMEKIEALAMEGLKIQCDMAEEEAPYDVDAFSWKEMVDAKEHKTKKGNSFGFLEGVATMQLIEGAEHRQEDSQSNDGLISMAISLEEWMRLDAGVYDESKNNEKTLAILAAHRAAHNELVPRGKKQGEQEKQKAADHQRKGGIMNDTLTLAMLVQLRDPLRNYDPVGSPMMALVQAERVTVPPRPKMWKRVSVKGNGEDDDDAKSQETQIPQFKITGVHMSGLNIRPENKNQNRKIWGNERQHQSGSRWLIANGMGKTQTSKHPLLKSKPLPAKTKVKQGESLWSISTRVHGSGSKWPEIVALNPHIRNPNVIFPNDIIRTR